MNDPQSIDLPRLLFAYGTLVPRDLDEQARRGWLADAVRGRLYDLGHYPAIVNLDDPTASWVEGFVRTVEAVELIEQLDPYEAVHEGLYRREATTTRGGRHVWIYVYARSLPDRARGPIAHWERPAHGYSAPSLDRNTSALEVTRGGDPCP